MFGRKSKAVKVAEGMFNCPRCGGRTKYVRKKEKYYFMFLFIPLYSLGSVVDYVLCLNCKQHFHTSRELLE
jgi:transcription elongation factor Elf1